MNNTVIIYFGKDTVMKTYSIREIQLIDNVIKPALEKWDQGKNTNIDNLEDWWYNIGRRPCSFCDHYSDLCEKCPLKDNPEKSCCNEWHKIWDVIDLLNDGKISKQEAFNQFHEEAVKLYNRISNIDIADL